jgi:predicted ribosomally synthesized peptide with nif11-like leader
MSKQAVYEFVARADGDAEIECALRDARGVDGVTRVAAARGFAFAPDDLAPVVDLLRFLDDARRDGRLRGELARAADPDAVVALARRRGYAFSSEELAHLDLGDAGAPLGDRDLDRVVGGVGLSDAVSSRMTLNVSAARQTPGRDFGDRMATGLSAGADSGGTTMLAAPFIPGAAIISAAISGVGQAPDPTSAAGG